MPDDQGVVAVAEAPQSTEVSQPQAASPSSDGETTAEAPQSTQLDFKTLAEQLLSHPDGRAYLLKHPELGKEIDHRADSKSGHLVKQRMEAWQRDQEAQAAAQAQRNLEVDLQRFVQDDPDHPLSQRLRPVLDASERQRTEAALHQRYTMEAGTAWLDMLAAQIATDPDIADDVKTTLNPRDPRFKNPQEFFAARDAAKINARAEKIVADRLKAETAAIREQVLGELRGGEKGPANLPQGSAGATDDKAFLEAYGRGDVNDRARARRLLGM